MGNLVEKPTFIGEAGVRMGRVPLFSENSRFMTESTGTIDSNGKFHSLVLGQEFGCYNAGATWNVGSIENILIQGASAIFGVNKGTLNIADRVGINIQPFTIDGNTTITAQAGIKIASLTTGVSNSAIVYGTNTLPFGNWGIYQGDRRQNYFNGGVRRAWRQASASTNLTREDYHLRMVNSGSANVTLPQRNTVPEGTTFEVSRAFFGSITLQTTGGDGLRDNMSTKGAGTVAVIVATDIAYWDVSYRSA